jgi:hypothetical protein
MEDFCVSHDYTQRYLLIPSSSFSLHSGYLLLLLLLLYMYIHCFSELRRIILE